MSIFGGNSSSRPEPKNLSEPLELSPKPESTTTILGDASQVLRDLPEPPPAPVRSSFAPEARLGGQAGPTPPERCANIIATGAKWKGTITVEDSVRIDGNFSGDIQAKGTVYLSEGAQVEAKVKAAYVVIGGVFRGEVRCDQRVELLPRARVNGDLITKGLTIQEGALIDGRVQMTGEPDARGSAAASLEVESTGRPATAPSGERTRNGR